MVGNTFNRQQAGCNSASSFLLVQSLESRKGESLQRPQLFLEHKHSSGHMSVHIPGTILEFLKLPWTSHSLAFWVGLTVSPAVIYCLKRAQCSAIVCNCFQNSPLGKRLFCWGSSKSSQTQTTSQVSLPGSYQTSQTRPVLGKGHSSCSSHRQAAVYHHEYELFALKPTVELGGGAGRGWK